jgi:C4-dicarboxylate transporter DctM subunit
VIYALVVGVFIYRELGLNEIYQALRDTMLINGATTFMLGLSISFAFLLTMKQVPVFMATRILSFSSSPLVVLMLINCMLLVVGCFIDNISSMVILAPILLPIMLRIGVDPVQFGVFMTVNLAIGFVTPPYGANLFIASAVARESMDSIIRYIWPLIFAMIFSLILITYIPWISLAVPKILKVM